MKKNLKQRVRISLMEKVSVNMTVSGNLFSLMDFVAIVLRLLCGIGWSC